MVALPLVLDLLKLVKDGAKFVVLLNRHVRVLLFLWGRKMSHIGLFLIDRHLILLLFLPDLVLRLFLVHRLLLLVELIAECIETLRHRQIRIPFLNLL